MIELDQVVESPIVWAAIFTLIGVLVGHVTGAWGKKRDHALAGLQASVEVLRAEYDRLSSEVRTLREEMEKTRKSKRLLQEKYSAAVIHIHALTVTLVLHGVPPDDIPAPPALISVDMQPPSDREDQA